MSEGGRAEGRLRRECVVLVYTEVSSAMIDLHCFEPIVPMDLGLIDRPLESHNLLSAQESPLPLPKLHMVPRLKILTFRCLMSTIVDVPHR